MTQYCEECKDDIPSIDDLMTIFEHYPIACAEFATRSSDELKWKMLSHIFLGMTFMRPDADETYNGMIALLEHYKAINDTVPAEPMDSDFLEEIKKGF